MINRRCVHLPAASFTLALVLFPTALAAQIRTAQLCSTGYTPKGPPVGGCLDSVLVYPINPESGGPIVDGNWDLAVPYPTAPYTALAPSPCALESVYRPAPVNAPDPAWYNPDDSLSQWISPIGGTSTPAGWYIYVTKFLVPPPYFDNTNYKLEASGRFMADNQVAAIYVSDAKDGLVTCGPVATYSSNGFQSWTPFAVSANVVPSSTGYMYFVVLNQYGTPNENPTGLRVEFQSSYFDPF